MKRKIVLSLMFIAIAMILWNCSAYATNILLITEEDTVKGDTVANMLNQIGNGEYTITEIPIKNGLSLEQTVKEFDSNGSSFDNVIFQMSYESIKNDVSALGCSSAINILNSKINSLGNTKYFIGTSVGALAENSSLALSQSVAQNTVNNVDSISISIIPVYENINTAANKSLMVYENGKLTTLGNLLVACTYSNSIGKPVQNLRGYEDSTGVRLTEDQVTPIIAIANGTSATVPEIETSAEEPEERMEDDTDQIEEVSKAIVDVNREPVLGMVGSDSTCLRIRVYDKENAGIVEASLKVNDSEGEKIDEERIDGDKIKSYVFTIGKERLSTTEYKQFLIYAKDNDGCILREYFRVKYLESPENGSHYKINRAPRVRPRLLTDTENVNSRMISLYVMDQTGVKSVIPRTVAENGLSERNLYADGNYKGYDGIEGKYAWEDVISKTTTGTKTYIKDAHTKLQSIDEFFKVENDEEVSLVLGNNKFRFNAHAVDTSGLATDRIMIVRYLADKEDEGDNDEGADKSSIPAEIDINDNTITTTNTNTNANTNTDTVTNTNTNEYNNTNTNTNVTTNTNTNANINTNVNTSNTNTNTLPKTSSTKTEIGKLKRSETTPGYAAFKTDREPRLKYIVQDDGLYIEISDYGGIACEFRTGNHEPQKDKQPQIYYYNNGKEEKVVPNLKRPVESNYNKRGKAYVYTIGLPIAEIGDEYKKFKVVASDLSQYHNYIKEVFMVKKSKDGKIIVNRAPTSNPVGLRTDFKKMALHVVDSTGISTAELRTIPKGEGKPFDVIRKWNGAIQDNWTAVTYTTDNNKYTRDGLTKFEKIGTLFKNTKWVGMNPKLAKKKNVYAVMIATADASGASSEKTIAIDTSHYVSGDEIKEIGNNKKDNKKSKKADSKSGTTGSEKSGTKATSKKAAAKKAATKNTSSKSNKKSKAKQTTSKNKKKKNTSGSSNNSSSGNDNSNASEKKSSNSSTSSKLVSALKKGASGEEVKKLQKRLNDLGWNLTVDGDYGSGTEKAVKEFQKLNGLTVNGIVDKATMKKLNSNNPKGKNSNSSSSENNSGSNTISKKNAKYDKNVFNIYINNHSDTNNVRTYIGNVAKDLGRIQSGTESGSNLIANDISINCNKGKIMDYDVTYNGIRNLYSPSFSKSGNNGKGKIIFYPRLNLDDKSNYVNSSETVYDWYFTVTGYYSDGKTTYKDTVRMHYVLAPDNSSTSGLPLVGE